MPKIPFKVSARTALLIGRESVSTPKGALIELVKNGYDADSPLSLIYFDNKFSDLPKSITPNQFEKQIKGNINADIFHELYALDNGDYTLKPESFNSEDAQLKSKIIRLREEFNKLNSIYIIDFGEGMTKKVIEDHWMTIGTDNKLTNMVTPNKRIKAGAKGIGRFALDKLGNVGEMITFSNPKDRALLPGKHHVDGYLWRVNWADFEAPLKTIAEVDAELTEIKSTKFVNLVKSSVDVDLTDVLDSIHNGGFDTSFGTMLKVSNLRDHWNAATVAETFSDLEVLVPPKENNDFRVYLYSAEQPELYGEVLSNVCDDYDYKLEAKADTDQNVILTVYRAEYDIEAIPDKFFLRKSVIDHEKLNKAIFDKGYWTETTTFSKLIPGFSKNDAEGHFKSIGPFEFNFYFMKKVASTPDTNRFFYKKFMSHNRKSWLKQFGGIKLYRDNFRVRPYGETNNVAFDWLALGNRKANSPAGVAKPSGGYRVEPENIAGSIKISRLTNLAFEDKSSREGLQENNTFKVFKTLIANIINKVEIDRSSIAREMAAFDDERFGGQRELERAKKLAEEINERTGNENKAEEKNDKEKILAHLVSTQGEQIENLEEEQKLLRGLASSGIVSASFGHDLSKLSDVFKSRIDKLSELIRIKVDEAEYQDVEYRKNPYHVMNNIKKQDMKVVTWLNFSLGFTKKDKRKRGQLYLQNYFNRFKSSWDSTLAERLIELRLDTPEEIEMRVFEIDFDSIFSNLLVNSIDQFLLSKKSDPRRIFISCASSGKHIIIEYRDTGPGLSKDIETPEDIFRPLFTTKTNESGQDIGTGLGMWIIKSVVEENSGKIKLLYPDKGFGVRITFPQKYKAKNG